MIGRPANRRILLTGGTSGIGFELARRWAPRHDIILTGRSRPPEVDALLERHENLRYVKADLSQPGNAVAAIASAISDAGWGGLDHAVLNAGTGYVCDPAAEDHERMMETVDTNLTASILLAHDLFGPLAERRGMLTLIGSTARRGAPDFASYAASKAGLDGLARALRAEWRGRVAVQMIHPGPTRTAMHEKAGFDPGRLRLLFTPPQAMAAMIDNAIARRRLRREISPLRYWAGEGLLARGL